MASVDGVQPGGGGGHECKRVCGCRSAVVGHYLPTSQTSHERRLFLGAGEGTGDSPGGLGASGAGLGRPLQSEGGGRRLGQQKDTIHVSPGRWWWWAGEMMAGPRGTGSAMLRAKGTKGCERMAATTSAARTAPGTRERRC